MATHQNLRVDLYHVEVSSYSAIQILDAVHPFWIISHVRQGHVLSQSRGLNFFADADDVMIHPPHIPFSEVADSPGLHQWMMLEATVEGGLDLLRLHRVAPVVRLSDAEQFSSVFFQLRKAFEAADHPFRDLVTTAHASTLLATLMTDWYAQGACLRPPELSDMPDQFAAVVQYMARHLDKTLHIPDLASVLHLQPNYFHRVFRQAFDMTPQQMLHRLRLERARTLLETTDDPLAVIATRVGIHDTAYFARRFRQWVGVPPSVYRKQARAAHAGYIHTLPPRPMP
jgi:AraC-like DNA-binding protein